MAEIKRSILFGKLNTLGYKAMEGGTTFCKMRGNPYVELVHWLHQVIQAPDSDILRILLHFGIDSSRLALDIIEALDNLPRGATSIMNFSPHLEAAIERGWVYGSLLFNDNRIRTGHIVIALVKTRELNDVFKGISREFARIKSDALSDNFATIVAGSSEDALAEPLVGSPEYSLPGPAINFCPGCGYNLKALRTGN
jgi:type VI secretion system protein VasG